jgi:hypothetical protein
MPDKQVDPDEKSWRPAYALVLGALAVTIAIFSIIAWRYQ